MSVSDEKIQPPLLHLAFQADQNYADGLVATLCGVAAHLPRAARAAAWVIDCGLRSETRRDLSALLAARFPRLSLEFLPVDAAALDRLPFPEGLRHANRSVYGRLFLPELLPALDRIIYLDCDLVVDADLSALAAVPLHGAVVAAVRDEEVKADTPEFNSGVMVMDLRAMRESGLTRRALETAGGHNTRHGDQTLLNELLRGRWTPLDRRWNRQVFLLPGFSVHRTEPRTLWHIYMGRKPWHFRRQGARGLVADYYALLDRAGWIPTSAPQLAMTTTLLRDLPKAALALLLRTARRLR